MLYFLIILSKLLNNSVVNYSLDLFPNQKFRFYGDRSPSSYAAPSLGSASKVLMCRHSREERCRKKHKSLEPQRHEGTKEDFLARQA